MKRDYYSASIFTFSPEMPAEIPGHLSTGSADADFTIDPEPLPAWTQQIEILQKALQGKEISGALMIKNFIPNARRIQEV